MPGTASGALAGGRGFVRRPGASVPGLAAPVRRSGWAAVIGTHPTGDPSPMECLAFPHSGSRARRRWARTVLALATVFSAVSITVFAFTPAASSQEDPGVTGARERLARAQGDADAARARYEQAVGERDQAQVRLN